MTDTLVVPHGIDPHVYHRRWYILGSLCLSLVLVVASVSSVNVAIPTLAEQLKPSDTEILWIVDAYGLVFAGLLFFAGALGDRFGRKGALLLGLTIFAVASVLCSQSTEPRVLIAMRAVMGIGAALIMPSTLSLLTSVFPPHERPRAIAIWAGFAGAGGGIGPLMGGLLLGHFWYGSVFFVSVPIAVIGFVAIYLLAPTSKEQTHVRLDPIGAALSIVGFSALLFAIIEGPERGWGDGAVIGGFVLAVIGLCAFVAWERFTTEPMLDLSYFSNPRFTLSAVGIASMFMAMFAIFFVLTQYLQYVRGYTALGAGLAGLPFAITQIVVAPRAATIAKRFGVRRVVSVGPLLGGIGLLGMSLVGRETNYWLLALAMVVTSAGMGVTMPQFTGGIMVSVPNHKAGVGSAVNDTSREFGGAVGIALIGSVITAVYRSNVRGALVSLPPELAAAARRNVGQATVIATRAAEGGASADSGLLTAVRQAFVDGGQAGMRVAAGIALLVAALLAWRYPEGDLVDLGH